MRVRKKTEREGDGKGREKQNRMRIEAVMNEGKEENRKGGRWKGKGRRAQLRDT